MWPSIKDYEKVVGPQAIAQLHRLAEPLQGKEVVHVNSTRTGGGVAEILSRLVPLTNELGLNCRWEVIEGNQGFFEVTKAFHNALQSRRVEISPKMLKLYEQVNKENAGRLNLKADTVIIHDPQPAPLIKHHPKHKGHWVWRCHIDVSRPERRVWSFLSRLVSLYDASVFSMPSFSRELPHPQYIINPSIDPLSDKNRELTAQEIGDIIKKLGLKRSKPLLVQISRFDHFKDPLGVIEAYRLVKKETDCQLVLAGGGATDDPEGAEVLAQVKEAAADDPDINVLMLPPESDLEINALQRAADIVLQKSIREGFGLTVTEAMWKGKPVIGGAVGGILAQLENKRTGFLVHSPEGAAYRIRYLLTRPKLIQSIGQRAKEYVRQNFLITRLLRDHLMLLTFLDQPGDRLVYLKAPKACAVSETI